MNDWEKVSAVFDLIESAEVMEEFEDSVWLKVDRDLWEAIHETI